jgi:hypothetical protein
MLRLETNPSKQRTKRIFMSSQLECGQMLHTFTSFNKVFVLLFVSADLVNSIATTLVAFRIPLGYSRERGV